MVERVQKYLSSMFKGVCVNHRNNVYSIIDKQIPFVKVITQRGESETIDKVTLDFGGVECQYLFIWGKSSEGDKERLSDIAIVGFNITNMGKC